MFDYLLKMTWLNNLVGLLLDKLRVDLNSKIGGSLQFFLFDTIKIFILLILMIYIVSYIQSYFPPERTKKIIGSFKGIIANTVAAFLGTITPFCSCSSIPLFIGFTSSGLPLGVTFSFLISSPLVDLGSLIILMSIFGFKTAIIYVLLGIFLAVLGGSIIQLLKLENEVEDFILSAPSFDSDIPTLSIKDRIDYSINQVRTIVKKVGPYIFIGVGIGALIHNWIPQDFILLILGDRNPFSVVIATLVGIPIYGDIFGAIPIAEALVEKGVGLGTVLAFMMSITALSLPSLIMLRKAIKPKLLVVFISIVAIGIMAIGYLFNILF